MRERGGEREGERENRPLTSQLLRFWKKKYRAAAHTTAVATMQTTGRKRTFSELRSCGEMPTTEPGAPAVGGAPGRPAPHAHSPS